MIKTRLREWLSCVVESKRIENNSTRKEEISYCDYFIFHVEQYIHEQQTYTSSNACK